MDEFAKETKQLLQPGPISHEETAALIHNLHEAADRLGKSAHELLAATKALSSSYQTLLNETRQ